MRNRRQFDVWREWICLLAAVEIALMVAFLLRFDFLVPRALTTALERAMVIAIAVKLPVFGRAGFYKGLRSFAGMPELRRLFAGNLIGSVLFAVVAKLCLESGIPTSILLIDGVLCFMLTSLIVFSARIYRETLAMPRAKGRQGIVIYGAGAAGSALLHEIQANQHSPYDVKGFVDDDPLKAGAFIRGVPVLGPGRQANSIILRLNRSQQTVEQIIIAMPSATGAQMGEAFANCRAAGIPCKTIPAVEQLISGRVSTGHMRDLSINDLLGRQPVKLDEAPVRAHIAGRSVLITGAAGSIGSELCRRVARFAPARLVVFDQAESDLFRTENELREKFPGVEVIAALGDIRDLARLDEVLGQQQVESIMHAAAYKHVPMMESHVLEAIRNNILGTWNLLCAAQRRCVRHFLMISSDKAVNPICIMGATKRVCERIVSARRSGIETKGVSVRFGNVLGSSGSVVPIFRAQIAAGGPVTVTHPEARRYFMTTSEAASLVLQTSAESHGGEIFVLDMGEPVRIVDLAENMIRLVGLTPYRDIDVQFTGLRPGEKLIEEINVDEALPTACQGKVRIIRECSLDWNEVADWINELQDLLTTRSESEVVSHMQHLVPEYAPVNHASITTKQGRSRPRGSGTGRVNGSPKAEHLIAPVT